MKTLLLFLSLAITKQILGDAPFYSTLAKPRPEVVYTCANRKAYAYHANRSSRGLNRCSRSIIKESKVQAVKDGYSRVRFIINNNKSYKWILFYHNKKT